MANGGCSLNEDSLRQNEEIINKFMVVSWQDSKLKAFIQQGIVKTTKIRNLVNY